MSPVFVEGSSASGGQAQTGPTSGSLRRLLSDPPDRSIERSAPAETPSAPHLFLRGLARESARALRVSKVRIWRFEGAGSAVRLVTCFNRTEGSIQEDRVYPLDLAAAFRSLLDQASALAVDDTQRVRVEAEPVREWLDAEGIRAILALPVRTRGGLVGLVTFEEARSPREWTPRDRDFASSLIASVGEPLGSLEYADTTAPRVRPSRRSEGTPAIASPGGPKPVVAPGPHTRVHRVRHLESAALLGAEEVTELLSALDVQAGYLRMLEEAAIDRPADRDLVSGALEVRSKLEAGLTRILGCLQEGVPDRVRVDLNRALPAMIPVLSREVGEGARLRVAPSVGPLPIEANVTLLERAMVHLVQNAREASGPEQSVKVTWGSAPEGSGGKSSWEGARIRVEDQGEGVPRRHLPWLFEPFFSSRSEAHPLRGLGLTTVQAIVEGHGGWVEVRSLQGEGTEVHLFFPIAGPVSSELTPGT